jgi:hypothetical protein
VTTEFVSWPPPCTRGNEAHGVFGRKLDSGDDGERPRGAGSGAPLACGEAARGSLWSYSTKVLVPRVGLPLRRGTNED